MSKKNYISIFTFIVLFIIGFIYLNKAFVSIDRFINTTEGFSKLTKKTIVDIEFLGSSYTYTSFNPLIINDKCKTISYNLGSVGLRTTLFDNVLNESLKLNKPKLIIVEAHYGTMSPIETEKDKGYQLIALDFISNFNLSKLKQVIDIYKPKEYLNVLYPLFRNHINWKKTNFKNLDRRVYFNQTTNYYYNGFRSATKIIKKKKKDTYKNFRNLKQNRLTKKYFSNRIKNDFLKIYQTSKNNNLQILFVTPPYVTARRETHYFNSIQKFCDSLKVPYLNNYFEKMDLKINDFQDLGHLNIYGSTKTSKFIAEYINKNYDFIDRWSDEIEWKVLTKELQNFNDEFKNNKSDYFSRKVNKELIPQIDIDSFNIKRNNRNYEITLKFKNTKILEQTLDKYNLGVHLYSTLKDKKTIINNTKKLVLDINLNSKKTVYNIKFYSKLKKDHTFDLFLFDKNGYKGIIGKKITINNIKFE